MVTFTKATREAIPKNVWFGNPANRAIYRTMDNTQYNATRRRIREWVTSVLCWRGFNNATNLSTLIVVRIQNDTLEIIQAKAFLAKRILQYMSMFCNSSIIRCTTSRGWTTAPTRRSAKAIQQRRLFWGVRRLGVFQKDINTTVFDDVAMRANIPFKTPAIIFAMEMYLKDCWFVSKNKQFAEGVLETFNAISSALYWSRRLNTSSQ